MFYNYWLCQSPVTLLWHCPAIGFVKGFEYFLYSGIINRDQSFYPEMQISFHPICRRNKSSSSPLFKKKIWMLEKPINNGNSFDTVALKPGLPVSKEQTLLMMIKTSTPASLALYRVQAYLFLLQVVHFENHPGWQSFFCSNFPLNEINKFIFQIEQSHP